MYVVWIRVDETLPWIEMKGTYQTKKEAKQAAEEFLNNMGIKIVKMPEKRRQIKAVPTLKC